MCVSLNILLLDHRLISVATLFLFGKQPTVLSQDFLLPFFDFFFSLLAFSYILSEFLCQTIIFNCNYEFYPIYYVTIIPFIAKTINYLLILKEISIELVPLNRHLIDKKINIINMEFKEIIIVNNKKILYCCFFCIFQKI